MRLRPALAVVALTTLTSGALASEPRFGDNDIETLFFISKSDDRNRVDYAIRLDSNCAPYGEEPVFPYWREFEPPPPVRTKSMGALSKIGYGISTQRVVSRAASGGETTIKLKQVGRAIFITTSRAANGRCSALVRTKIANIQYAELLSIFVKLSGPLSVSYIEVKGQEPRDSQADRGTAAKIGGFRCFQRTADTGGRDAEG